MIFLKLRKMKNYLDLLIKAKVSVIVGVVVVLGALLYLIPLRTTSLSNSSRIAKMHAQEAGTMLSLKINASADIVRNYSYLITHLAATDLIPNENKRQFMLAEMEIRYRNESALNNLWCTFEPNALDGMDRYFINRPGSNELGVFDPWFAYGNLATSPTDDYVEDYYTISKTTKKEAVTDPYWDEINGINTLMISFSAPIMLDDEFIGAVGTDFYINDLKELIEIDNIVGVGNLITDKGIIVINKNPELIGEAYVYSDDVQSRVAEGKMFDKFYSSYKGDTYKVFVPVYFGKIENPWVYVVEVSARQIYAEARKTVGAIMIIIVLLVASIYFYVKTIEKNKELEKLNTVKDKLFSVVAHDLRSPIGSLTSLLKLTSDNMVDADTQTQMLKEISKRVDDVYGLLDNLLRWAKSQMKGMVKTPVYFDAQSETRSVTDGLFEIAAEKQIHLRNHIEKQKVFGDRDIFSVVVRNLTTNALKFTPAGGEITLNSELTGNMLVVSVKDTGIGISQEVQDHLFKLSETHSQRGTNNETGTGLGLVLCADFVKANGGQIWFNSKQGEGSTFFFNIPLTN